jgi:hypothetical protein
VPRRCCCVCTGLLTSHTYTVKWTCFPPPACNPTTHDDFSGTSPNTPRLCPCTQSLTALLDPAFKSLYIFFIFIFLLGGRAHRPVLWKGGMRSVQGVEEPFPAARNLITPHMTDNPYSSTSATHPSDDPKIPRSSPSRAVQDRKTPYLNQRLGQHCWHTTCVALCYPGFRQCRIVY